jgi:hypothetical protein
MANMEPQQSVSAGSLIFEYVYNGTWPPSADEAIIDTPGNQCRVFGFVRPNGSVVFEITNEQGVLLSAETVPIQPPLERVARFGLTWAFPDQLAVFANGEDVIARPVLTTQPVQLSAGVGIPASDFMAANAAAKSLRDDAMAALQPRAGCRLRSLDEEVTFLEEAVAQLEDFLAMIQAGKQFYARSCASLVRAMIAESERKGSNFKPLLQRVAGRLAAPLIVYASAPPIGVPVEYPPDTYFDLDISARQAFGLVPLDIDVWLRTEIQLHDGRRFTNNSLIRTIADANASHYDPDVNPTLEMLEDIKMFVRNTPVPITVAFPAKLSVCLVEVAKTLIAVHRGV